MIGMNLALFERCAVSSVVEVPPAIPHGARYWRIFMPVPNPITPADYLAIGRVWMYRGGRQLGYDGASTSESSAYNGRTAALAFRTTPMADPQAVADAWTSVIANPVNQWIEVDFGADREIDEVVLVPLTFRNGIRNPQTLVIQSSDDEQLWTTLVEASGLAWTDGAQKSFVIRAPTRRIAPMQRWAGERIEPPEFIEPEATA